MKKHTLELVKYLLENPEDKNFEIKVDSEIARRAYKPIQKMLDFS
jgi:quinolinate synthase